MARFTRFAEGHFRNIALRGGVEWMVSCPFHGGSDSLQFNVETGRWYCFGCHRGGDISRLTDETVPDYVPSMAKLRHTLNRLMDQGSEELTLPKEWLAQFDLVHDYWSEDRGLREETIERWHLGYDIETDSVTIPLFSFDGKAIHGVIKRRLDPDARIKYRYPSGFERKSYLFGEHAVSLGEPMLFVTEGGLDAIALDEVGASSVAVLGSSLTRLQRERLVRLCPETIVLAFDNDSAGEAATERALEALHEFKVVVFPWERGIKDFGDYEPVRRGEVIDEFMADFGT